MRPTFIAPGLIPELRSNNAMYLTVPGMRLGDPPKTPPKTPPIQKSFVSKAITYKDAAQNCQSAKCALFIPAALIGQPKMDVAFFFHGLDTCSPSYNADPENIIKNFKLSDQI